MLLVVCCDIDVCYLVVSSSCLSPDSVGCEGTSMRLRLCVFLYVCDCLCVCRRFCLRACLRQSFRACLSVCFSVLCLSVGAYACLYFQMSWLCTVGVSVCVACLCSFLCWFVCESLCLCMCVVTSMCLFVFAQVGFICICLHVHARVVVWLSLHLRLAWVCTCGCLDARFVCNPPDPNALQRPLLPVLAFDLTAEIKMK